MRRFAFLAPSPSLLTSFSPLLASSLQRASGRCWTSRPLSLCAPSGKTQEAAKRRTGSWWETQPHPRSLQVTAVHLAAGNMTMLMLVNILSLPAFGTSCSLRRCAGIQPAEVYRHHSMLTIAQPVMMKTEECRRNSRRNILGLYCNAMPYAVRNKWYVLVCSAEVHCRYTGGWWGRAGSWACCVAHAVLNYDIQQWSEIESSARQGPVCMIHFFRSYLAPCLQAPAKTFAIGIWQKQGAARRPHRLEPTNTRRRALPISLGEMSWSSSLRFVTWLADMLRCTWIFMKCWTEQLFFLIPAGIGEGSLSQIDSAMRSCRLHLLRCTADALENQA